MEPAESDYWEYMRRGSIYPLYADHCVAWTNLTAKYFGYHASHAVAYFSNDTVFFRVSRKETSEGGKRLCEHLLSDSAAFRRFESIWRRAHSSIKKWISDNEDISSYSVRTCIAQIASFSEINKEVQAVWSSKEFFDAYLSENGYRLEGTSFSKADSRQIETIRSMLARCPDEILNRHAVGQPSDIDAFVPGIDSLVKEYGQEYGWTGTNYADVILKDMDYFVSDAISSRRSVGMGLREYPLGAATYGKIKCNDSLFKLFDERKEIMLKSFYLVHLLYEKIGRQYGLYPNQCKWVTPSEWVDIADKGLTPDEGLIAERMHCSYLDCRDGVLEWVTGAEAYKKECMFRRRYLAGKSDEVRGERVCEGAFAGRCVVCKDGYELPDDGERYILVTGMTTPDMVPFLSRVSAVVTDEGGVTSHAAIMCREIGIPCIVGTRIGTYVFKTGDCVCADAGSSMVRRTTELRREIPRAEYTPVSTGYVHKGVCHAVSDIQLSPDLSKEAGNKSCNCAILKKKGFNVPDGFTIYGDIIDPDVIADAIFRFATDGKCRYAVRSSAPAEDSDSSSCAGRYTTYLNVPKDELVENIVLCARRILREIGCFSVLVQKMVDGIASGVAFTSNVPAGRYDLILVEACRGIGGVVDGRTTPQRFFVKKSSGFVERVDINPTLEPHESIGFTGPVFSGALISPGLLSEMCASFSEIESFFGYPCDIEWSVDNAGVLYILQCRIIVFKNKKK